MDRKLWHALGGLDDNFKEPGGGFVNLDLWERAVALSNQQPWMILGEGTFHQVHGGAATSGSVDDRAKMHDEYVRIKGRQYAPPQYRACFVGRLDPSRPYQGFEKPLDTWRHAHSVRGRHFRVNMHAGTLRGIQHGTLRTRYKGLRLCKSPFDLALYTQAIAQLRPTTIIEIGTSEGGSAAWFIDQCGCLGLTETRLITIDLAPPAIEIENVRMFRGDSLRPDSTFPNEAIEASGHPWLVIEDSAHTRESTLSVLEYFDRRLKPGDMLVIEDGVIADLEGQVYRVLDDGPNRAVAEFLDRKGDCYVIDTSFCDFYGHNLTWAPNAWLRRL
jgi:cephalosporin hydroxylase